MKATSFVFTNTDFNAAKKEASFSYRIDFSDVLSLEFTERLVFPKALKTETLPEALLNKSLQDLHIVLGLSYYKLYCPSKFEVPYAFSAGEAKFWNMVYQKGLGEFLYRNNIPRSQVASFKGDKYAEKEISVLLPRKRRSLLGIGGGKDSIVAGELLKRSNYPFDALLIETESPSTISANVVEVMGVKSLTVKRFLDPKIFQPHPDSYNGHVPISAMFAFIGHFTALLYDYDSVVVGNEASSNFGNVVYQGDEVNHQWSKSGEFEALLLEHTRTRRTESIRYFSLLRPWYEIRIAEAFSKYPEYFSVFSSCNKSFRVHEERSESLWCGECPKCVFVFTLLSAFVSKSELINIFGKNLYQNEALLPLFKDIVGLGTMKPFDCVGTFEEAQTAFILAAEKYANTKIIQALLPLLPPLDQAAAEQLFRFHESPVLPEHFSLVVADAVLLLGLGKEGEASKRFLEKFYPHITITSADQKDNSKYLEEQYGGYDVIIKTPGIPKTALTVSYTTATNIFFSLVDRQQTIGITGTKGKSTTSSLIAHFLDADGKKVALLGNVGNPMLDVFKGSLILPEQLFVLELSSYQLDDIRYSPHIALLVNLYQDHLPYHGSAALYQEAKANITRFQTPNDIFIFPAGVKLPASFTATLAEQKTFQMSPDPFPTALLGAHNQENIAAAWEAVKTLGVSEETVRTAVKDFQPLPHRLEKVGTFKGITFYNDAISTTPESTMAALEALEGVDTIFLGGEDRGYDFEALEKVLRKSGVRNIVLFPESGKRILKNKDGFTILETKRMAEAVAFAYEHTAPGKIVLLSTASPSYGLWKNFEEKGEIFTLEVQKKGK